MRKKRNAPAIYAEMLECALECYYSITHDLEPFKRDPRAWTKIIAEVSAKIDTLAKRWGTQ